MHLRHNKIVLCCFVMFGKLVGCAQTPGNPWGILEPTLQIAFQPSAARLDRSGALKTDLSYRVLVQSADVTVKNISFAQEAEESSTTSAAFDPAKPPEGYSLCHNGHCHHSSGRLVPYEEIQASSGDSGQASEYTIEVKDQVSLSVFNKKTSIVLNDSTCTEQCFLSQGHIIQVKARISALRIRACIFDNELPIDGKCIDWSNVDNIVLTRSIDKAIDSSKVVHYRPNVQISLGDKMFDGIDFKNVSDAQAKEAWLEALQETIQFNIDE